MQVDLAARPAPGSGQAGQNVLAGTYHLTQPADADAVARVRGRLGGRLLGLYVSDPTPNNFPALPIREGEHLLTWFASGHALPEGDAPDEVLRLVPTARSVLR